MEINDFVDHVKSYLAYLIFGSIFLFFTTSDMYSLYYKGALYTGTVIETKKVGLVRKKMFKRGLSEVSIVDVGSKYPIYLNGKLDVGKEYTFRLYGNYPDRTQSVYTFSHAVLLIEFHFLFSALLFLKGVLGINRIRKKYNRVIT